MNTIGRCFNVWRRKTGGQSKGGNGGGGGGKGERWSDGEGVSLAKRRTKLKLQK